MATRRNERRTSYLTGNDVDVSLGDQICVNIGKRVDVHTAQQRKGVVSNSSTYGIARWDGNREMVRRDGGSQLQDRHSRGYQNRRRPVQRKRQNASNSCT